MSSRRKEPEYLICVSNEGYEVSLVVRRLYQRLPDPRAAQHGLVRVIDEAGEDYLFPEKLFTAVPLPKAIGRKLAVAT